MEIALILFISLLVIAFYFLPTVIAWQKDHDSLLTIFFMNLFLGWTGLVWIATVIWASAGGNKTSTVIHNVVNQSQPSEKVIGHSYLGQSNQSTIQPPSEEIRIKCPDCSELILHDARKCKHCGLILINDFSTTDTA